jgi:hypothetical protein
MDIIYASGPGGLVAYSTLGNGSVDALLCDNWVTNLEIAWEQPLIESLHRRLAAFSRLVVFDKRGTSISDPIPGTSLSMVPTIEEGTSDRSPTTRPGRPRDRRSRRTAVIDHFNCTVPKKGQRVVSSDKGYGSTPGLMLDQVHCIILEDWIKQFVCGSLPWRVRGATRVA